MKKTIICAAVALCVSFALAGLAFAGQGAVGNTTQKGSLLIWPKIDVTEGKDTIIRINNDYNYFTPTEELKCYWMRGFDQVSMDFQISLTRNQPVWFSARTGRGSKTVEPFFNDTAEYPGRGALICWAVDTDGDAPVSYNHLYGSATVLDYSTGTAAEYNSWNFAAIATLGTLLGGSDPGSLKLTGNSGDYDAGPSYLVSYFPAYTASFSYTDGGSEFSIVNNGSEITIMPLRQDLKNGGEFTHTTVTFDVWDENSVRLTKAYKCVLCWYEGQLHEIAPGYDPLTQIPNSIGGFGGDHFWYGKDIWTNTGRLQVRGTRNTACESSLYVTEPRWAKYNQDYDALGVGPKDSNIASPLVGVLVDSFLIGSGDSDDESGRVVQTARELNAAGKFIDTKTPVTIKWDLPAPIEELAK